MNGPSPETLAKLAPQVDAALANPDGRCSNGGQLVAKAKIGGYMTRRLVHWRQTGVYPDSELVWQPGCDSKDCVACGAFVPRTAKRNGYPAPIETVPPPPPVPADVARVPVMAGGVEAVERGAKSEALVPVVPGRVPGRRSIPAPVRRAGVRVAKWAALLVACLLVVTVAVQGVRAVWKELSEVVDVKVNESPSSTLPSPQ